MNVHANDGFSRSDPAGEAYNLASGNLSDTVNLAQTPKAFEVWNGTSSAVVVKVTPVGVTDADPSPVTFTIPPLSLRLVPLGVRRIWSTGSTGLAAGLAAGTVEVVCYTR